MEQFALPLLPERRVFTVAELNAEIRRVFDEQFRDVWVSGEISGVKLAASGHYYFTLKEREAQIRCVCFRSAHRYFKFKPQDGVAVVARGRLDVYEARGEYQLLVEFLEPQGHGALQLAFEQLKQKLAAAGLFDSARKRPLPRYPRRIGIVTSPRGAVIADMIQILTRRFPGVHVRLYPALVQGEGAAEEVVRGIEQLGRSGWPEVVIVARGGGSIEDLWTFNEEAVARAIAACPVPVISAVGHETDVTIADFVADLRAPTPSAAAEIVLCTRQELEERLLTIEHKLVQFLRYRTAMLARSLERQLASRALPLLQRTLGRRMQRVDELEYGMRETLRARLQGLLAAQRRLDERLRRNEIRPQLAGIRLRMEHLRRTALHATTLRLAARNGRLASASARLEQLSPLKVLERGYAIVTDAGGAILKEAAAAVVGSGIDVRLARGRLGARVTGSDAG